jgi:hypothetical protein
MNLQQFNIPNLLVEINRAEIYAVLGVSAEAQALVDEYIDEVFMNGPELLQVSGGYLIVEDIEMDSKLKRILVNGIPFSINKIIFQQLKLSENIAVFACTIGDAVYERSRTLMKNNEMLHGYIYDIYGSLAVENAMEHIQNNLKLEMAKTGSGISNRYSPGYCGWMVSEQNKLFSLLPPGFCGISLSDSCLMQPIKSVSGFIGIGSEIHHKAYSCEVCDSSQCLYRNLKHNA